MIKVSLLQRGNKLLDYLSSTSWHYDTFCIADYEINFSTSVLFLSLKFHSAKPEYIYNRISKLKAVQLKVLVILIDTPNFNTILQELFQSVKVTIVLCKSYEECAKYIKGFDLCSRRGSEILRRKEGSIDAFIQALPKTNKSDVSNIKKCFNTLQDLFNTNEQELENIDGIGKIKALLLIKSFKKPFKKEF
ncbi:ssDNA endonuclease and repair protein rad10 [Glugoides intestinalis]